MSSMEHIPTACNRVVDDIGDWMMMIIKMMMVMMMIMVWKKKIMIMIARIRMIDDQNDNDYVDNNSYDE